MSGSHPGLPGHPGRSAAPGTRPDGPWATLLWAAVPVLTIGFFACVPSVRTAVRRQRPADWAAAAVFTVSTVAMWVAVGLGSDTGTDNTADDVGMTMMIVNMLGAPLHAVVAGWAARLAAARQAAYVPPPGAWYGGASGWPGQPAGPVEIPPQAAPGRFAGPWSALPEGSPPRSAAETAPFPAAPASAVPPVRPVAPVPPPAPVAPSPAVRPDDDRARAELRELGRLLRDQAGGGSDDPPEGRS